MTRNQNFRASPVYRLEIPAQSLGPKSFRPTNAQIVVGLLAAVAFIGFTIFYGQRNALFSIQGIRWESQKPVCRVFFTVTNQRDHAINASAAIMAFDAIKVQGKDFTHAIYDLRGSAKVPIKLEGKETRLLTHDVAFSGGRPRCSHVEITRLAAQSPAKRTRTSADL